MLKRYRKHTIVFFVLSLLLAGKSLFAQDPTFSQFNLNQYYYNPAFTGDHGGYQFQASYRSLWPNVPGKVIPGALSNYYGVFDAYIQQGKSYAAGAGIFAMQNVEGEGMLKTSSVGLSYAQHLFRRKPQGGRLSRIQMSLGFKAYLNFISIDWDRLVFSDQISIDRGITGTSAVGLSGIGRKTTADLDVGLLVKGNFRGKDKWYNELGLGMAHVLSPSLSMTEVVDANSRLPRKYHGSYRTSISLREHRYYVGTTLLFENQQQFYAFNTGLDLYINPKGGRGLIPIWVAVMHRVALGSQAGNINAFIGSIKYKWLMGKGSRTIGFAGFTADLPYTGLGLKSHGAYELTIGVVLPRKGNDYFSRCPFSTY
ncbi:MAG: PorP/SprF family type IX secretion system membrane protein [Chitinophagales bacterium]|nr:PorP/SprF family type IX secretion system membrane protein [Chitinophagales bacterium]